MNPVVTDSCIEMGEYLKFFILNQSRRADLVVHKTDSLDESVKKEYRYSSSFSSRVTKKLIRVKKLSGAGAVISLNRELL
jgi:hypothetical protein